MTYPRKHGPKTLRHTQADTGFTRGRGLARRTGVQGGGPYSRGLVRGFLYEMTLRGVRSTERSRARKARTSSPRKPWHGGNKARRAFAGA